MKLKSFIIICLVTWYSGMAQELALARLDDKFGYINSSGEWAIEPQFESAKNFSDDLAEAINDNGKWGFINRKGEWEIAPKFERVKDFYSGIGMAQLDDNWFYINKKGEQILKEITGEKLYSFSEGFAIYRVDDYVGFIDTNGNIIVEPKFIKALDFKNGYARVKLEETWGLIDTTGNYYVEPKYKRISDVHAGIAVAETDDSFGLIINGEFKIVEGADKVWEFTYNEDYAYARKDDKIGFINSKGEWIIEPQFDKARAFINGLAPVMKNKKWGYVDTSGNLVIDYQFKDAEVFSDDGLAPVKIKKLWGFINKEGELIIEDKYDIQISTWFIPRNTKKNMTKMGIEIPSFGFISGLARVKHEKKWGYINPSGKLLNDTWYINLELFN